MNFEIPKKIELHARFGFSIAGEREQFENICLTFDNSEDIDNYIKKISDFQDLQVKIFKLGKNEVKILAFLHEDPFETPVFSSVQILNAYEAKRIEDGGLEDEIAKSIKFYIDAIKMCYQGC